MLNIVEKRNIPFIISSVLFVVSVFLLAFVGLKPGIDFTGGTLMEVRFTEERPSLEAVQAAIDTLDLGGVQIQPTNEDAYLFKLRFLSEEEHQMVLIALRDTFATAHTEEVMEAVDEEPVEVTVESTDDADVAMVVEEAATQRILEERVETIGPSISSEFRSRALKAGIAVMIAIILFVAYAFRKVSKPVSSWKFGITAIIALLHDVTITMGVFVLLGKYFGVEVDIPFVVALLTILGYSVNDTIVVFDRIREKLIKRGYDRFAETVNMGVNETLSRSINTSLTTLLVLTALFLFGGDSIHYFSLALMLGILLGTYSSIFLASPLLVVWEEYKQKSK
ncbi:MAG: protein translocase subunit SecF [Candidatus Magasanikbacteria bacterium CG10_big_fil_rev_8_21_14_0_10_43_6]|uniref:Protein-export membrane protein SecF n=1 Tax=Candidatus Magasanikbacteria bacterium CG10_big_fil_rev_8_21_14_0_10_43_6 TaxID=1974650 RepID=A0A2M6W049_9BACT|nr:MAG: protein translocase subunit SecF [Candidatus Magasanikbacteria bacterium CG10_big_fil_rev_8_21_14_0_10_43_6]